MPNGDVPCPACRPCSFCDGCGQVAGALGGELETCPWCRGDGRLMEPHEVQAGFPVVRRGSKCRTCGGSGSATRADAAQHALEVVR